MLLTSLHPPPSPPSGYVLHPCSSRGGRCVVTQCVSCSSHHWPACQDGCVFKEPWTFTTPTAWRPWGFWFLRWPSLPYTFSGPWYVQGLLLIQTEHIMHILPSITFSAAMCKAQTISSKMLKCIVQHITHSLDLIK